MKSPKKGRIRWNKNWRLTPKVEIALKRLTELGVTITSATTPHEMNFELQVPFELEAAVYVEIGYLFAQLGGDEFPDDFGNPSGLSMVDGKVLRCHALDVNPVRFDVDPDSLKFILYSKEDLEQLRIWRKKHLAEKQRGRKRQGRAVVSRERASRSRRKSSG